MFTNEFRAAHTRSQTWLRYCRWTRYTVTASLLFTTGYFSFSNNPASEQVASISFWLGLAVFCVGFFVELWLKSTIQNSLWEAYIASVGDIHNPIEDRWKYQPSETNWTPLPRGGPVLLDGTISQPMGSEQQVPSRYGLTHVSNVSLTYSLSAFSNASSLQFSLDYFVIAIDLGVPTPHIFIDGTSQNRFTFRSRDLWSLAAKLRASDRVQDLEGDFYKFFKVYAADKEYLNSLTILTPDAMLALRDKGYSFDYEIYDGMLYVIHTPNLSSIEEYDAVLGALDAVAKELIPQIVSHTYQNGEKKLEVRLTSLRIQAFLYGVLLVAAKFAWPGVWIGLGIWLSSIVR